MSTQNAVVDPAAVNYGASNYEGTNYWTVTDNDPNGLAQEAELERLQEIRERQILVDLKNNYTVNPRSRQVQINGGNLSSGCRTSETAM